jgi:hypothetical protein
MASIPVKLASSNDIFRGLVPPFATKAPHIPPKELSDIPQILVQIGCSIGLSSWRW